MKNGLSKNPSPSQLECFNPTNPFCFSAQIVSPPREGAVHDRETGPCPLVPARFPLINLQ